MSDRVANLIHGRLLECPKHKKGRAYKHKVTKPTSKCLICNLVWLADRLETSIYETDVEDIIKFSNTFQTVIKPSSIKFVETRPDDD